MPPEFFIRETDHLSIAALAAATNATFADYLMPVSHTAAGFAAFCRGFSIDLAQSVLLEHQDGTLVGLGMLALRGTRGWCGGLGLVPQFRSQGLGTLLVGALLDRARAQGLVSLQLEVLVQNPRAIRAYTRAGFQTWRDLVILSGEITHSGLKIDPALDIQSDATPDAAWVAAQSLPAAPPPCWQRDTVSLLSQTGARALTARNAGQTVGSLLYRLSANGGPLIVNHFVFTDDTVAHTLLARATTDTKITQIFVLNEPEGSPLHALAPSLRLREVNRQHEMTLAL